MYDINSFIGLILFLKIDALFFFILYISFFFLYLNINLKYYIRFIFNNYLKLYKLLREKLSIYNNRDIV